jgi:pimeloyl-ACP methyl ester carboxylesterase
MLEKCEIRFLPLGARRVAYEIRGDGPPLVAPAWWVSHLELDWQSAGFRRFWQGIADGYTLIRYDRLGAGMSDRAVPDSDLTLDQEVVTLRALLDELDLERVSLLGGSSGSCTAVAFAATFPERVEHLVLYGSYADGTALTAPGVGDALMAAIRAHWGLGSRLLSDIFIGGADSAEQEHFARFQRDAVDAETAAALLGFVYRPRRDRRAGARRARAGDAPTARASPSAARARRADRRRARGAPAAGRWVRGHRRLDARPVHRRRTRTRAARDRTRASAGRAVAVHRTRPGQLAVLAACQDTLLHPWRHFAGGCVCNRPTIELMVACGFTIAADDAVWRGMPPIVHPLLVGRGQLQQT